MGIGPVMKNYLENNPKHLLAPDRGRGEYIIFMIRVWTDFYAISGLIS
jgi:hypothetical protein